VERNHRPERDDRGRRTGHIDGAFHAAMKFASRQTGQPNQRTVTGPDNDGLDVGEMFGRHDARADVNAPDGATVVTLDLPAGSKTELSLTPKERQYVEKTTSGARLRGHAAATMVTQVYGDSTGVMELLGRQSGVILWNDDGAGEGVPRALNELRARAARFAALEWIEGTMLAILAAGAT
jgi:hypothetical protein